MTSKDALFVVLVSVFVGSAIDPPESYAAEFQSPEYGYRIDLPPGWVEIPSDELQDWLSVVLKDAASTRISYEAAFQLASADEWPDYPIVTVNAVPYARFALSRQLTDAELPKFVQELADVDARKLVENAFAPGVVTNIDFGRPWLDEANRRYLWEISGDVPGVGQVGSLIVGYFGREAIVQVAFHTRGADWHRDRSAREAFISGFRFDAPMRFRPGRDPAAAAMSEMREGRHVTFSTKGHPNAAGVHFTIAYPEGWIAAEREGPDTVQGFIGGGFLRVDSMMIIFVAEPPFSMGAIQTEQDQIKAFSAPRLREMVPRGSRFVRSERTRIAGAPAGIIEYAQRGGRSATYTRDLVFITGQKFVMIKFIVTGDSPWESEVELSRRMAEFKPLFELMANSIVFPDKQASSASEGVSVALIDAYGATLLKILAVTIPLTIAVAVVMAVLSKRKALVNGSR